MRRRLIALGVVLGVLLVVYIVATVSPSATRAPTGQMTAVTSVVRACGPSARLSLVAAPASGDTAGAATLSAVGGNKTTTLTAPRSASLISAPSGTTATEVSASGAMAEGLDAEQASTSGVGEVRCTDPGSDLWFVGTGQAAGASSIRLYLINTDALAATVNVLITTDSGAVSTEAFSGITVPPHQTVTESLTAAVDGSQVVALNVISTAGRVAAAVLEGSPGSGTWLPEAAAPSTSVIIPGLSAASSEARLFIAVPGQTNASVSVTALSPQGRLKPFGSTLVSASASAASEFALSSLGAGTDAIELTSDVPITAAVLVPGIGIGTVTSAVAPVSQQSVVAGNPVRGGYSTRVLVSAPGASARVAVSTIPATSPATDVTVRSGRTVSIPVAVPSGARGTFAVVVTPLAGSGPVYAARVITSGGAVDSIIPLVSALTSVTLPAVSNSYTAVMP